MAVTPMKSVTVVGHAALRTEILTVLHGLGVMQLVDVSEEMGQADGAAGAAAGEDRGRLIQQTQSKIAETDRQLSEVTSCLNYISRWNRVQQGLVESFLAAKEEVSKNTWEAAGEFDYSDILATCQHGETRLGEIRTRETDLAVRIRELQPFGVLDLDLGALTGTAKVASYFSTTTELKLEALSAALASIGAPYHLERMGTVGRQVYFLLLYFRDDAAIAEMIRTSGTEAVSLPDTGTTAAEAIRAAESELAALAAEREALAEAGGRLVEHRPVLHTLYDRLLLDRQRYEAQYMLAPTGKTFVLSGWCPGPEIGRLEQGLAPFADSVAIITRDPGPHEQPPITLTNKPLTKPFEIVTNIYGWPSYHEIDPTPLLTPFFVLFFAIALTDAIYGLLMMAYCVWMMRKPTTPKSAHKFFRLLTIGGFATFVMGALTGGWMGDALNFLPPYLGFITRFKDAIIVFDPVKEPMTLMILSLVLGLIHLMVGIGIKAYMNIKHGRVFDALVDQGLWLVLLPSLALMAGGSALGPAVASIGKYLAIGSVGGLILTQGRSAKNLIGKIFGGLYSLYGLIGYLSDTLSYSRLLALGLATASLGMAINQIALMVRPVPFVGIILMLAIMAFGHGISLLINVFGAFIHSGRLQFIEFFTKFFEGGGKAFKPFAQRPRYTEVSPD